MNSEVAGFLTIAGPMSANRFGYIINKDGITAVGHFMHYFPSTSEWITGKTQFYTLAKDCILEFYADATGSNAELIKIDGHNMDTLKYNRKPLPIFQNKYFQFIVKIKGYGLHTFENDGNYVAYVICKHVNGYYNANGYLTGFSQRVGYAHDDSMPFPCISIPLLSLILVVYIDVLFAMQ
uniref:CUB_2 domain-containing protein n=1 Tax=Rhabditophanes sp. KR3021 TaxID=114890 RepID=A0AC35TTS4_9BILA